MKKRSQYEHGIINISKYPGTRQLCEVCDEPTGRCEDDSIYLDLKDFNCSLGPLCEECANLLLKQDEIK